MKIKNRIVAANAALIFASACTNSTAIALGVNDTDDTQEPMTLYTTDWLRVREYPSLEAEIIDVYAPGTAISATDVTNKYNGWIQMKYGSHKYYMHSDWLTMEKPEEHTDTEIITDDTTEEETPVIEESVEEESSVDDLIEVSSVDDTYIEDDCSEDTTDDSTSEEPTDYDYTHISKTIALKILQMIVHLKSLLTMTTLKRIALKILQMIVHLKSLLTMTTLKRILMSMTEAIQVTGCILLNTLKKTELSNITDIILHITPNSLCLVKDCIFLVAGLMSMDLSVMVTVISVLLLIHLIRWPDSPLFIHRGGLE